MLSSGFNNAPISKILVGSLIASSIVVSIADLKYLFYINVVPHLWQYKQAWRLLVWQACYTNSTEVLFSAMTLYHMRVIERLWGSRKFSSFILSILLYTAILPPMILALLLRPLSFNHLNYLPAGPTAIIFALLAQYHAVIPHVYKYRVATSSSPSTRGIPELIFSDKSMTYLLAAQLALSQFPGSILPAAVGWVLGHAWRSELLPGAARWRIPGWFGNGKSDAERYEALRRRLEGESTAAASGVEGQEAERGRQRRPLGTQILDHFRGRF